MPDLNASAEADTNEEVDTNENGGVRWRIVPVSRKTGVVGGEVSTVTISTGGVNYGSALLESLSQDVAREVVLGETNRPSRRAIARKPTIRSRRTFLTTARWEGVVLEVFGTYFSAEVIDLLSDEVAYAEFELAEVSAGDRALCEPGALFYWSIGYEVRESLQRSRNSVLKFRRSGVQ